MKKLSIKINLSQLDKTKIETRTYEKNTGETVTEKNYPCDLIPLKSEKLVKVGQNYQLYKVAFLSDKSVKNEDGTYTNGNIIGEAFEFRDVNPQPVQTTSYNPETGEVNTDRIPF